MLSSGFFVHWPPVLWTSVVLHFIFRQELILSVKLEKVKIVEFLFMVFCLACFGFLCMILLLVDTQI